MKVESLELKMSRAFGMEFEFTRSCSQEALEEAIRYAIPGLGREGVRIADWEHTPPDNVEWVVKRDGSCGWEISTPKSKGRDDLDRCCEVLDACRKVGAKVGPRTGVHLHYEVRDFNRDRLGTLIAYWVKMEGMLFFALPRKRRANPFCASLSRIGDLKPSYEYSSEDLIRIAGGGRYRALNIKPYLNDMARIEVRVIEGTLNPEVIRGWTLFFHHFVERCRESEHPADLRWFGLDEALVWLRWYGGGGDSVQYVPSEEMAWLRDWWLGRIVKHSSVVAKRMPAAWRERAKQFLQYFREGNH